MQPMIAILIVLAAGVTSSVRAQRLYPYGGYNTPPAVTFRGHATLLTPAEAAAAQGANRAPPQPLRLSTGYVFGDGHGHRGGTAFDGENTLYDGRSAHSAHSALTHANLITRYQPVHDLPVVENQRKFFVPKPYEKYVNPDEGTVPYTSERYASASSTSPTYVERPVNLISPMVYGYSYGSKYNNHLAGLPALQLAARGAEPGFYGKKPDFPGVKAARSLTSRGSYGYKEAPVLGFFGKS